MNTVQIMGFLGQDPEIRHTQSNAKVTTLSIGDTQKTGRDTKETIWWRCTVWGEQFDKMMPYIKKGSALVITGEMKPLKMYQKKDGSQGVSPELTVSNIQFAPFGKKDEGEQGANTSTGAGGYQAGTGQSLDEDIVDDDLPF